MPKKIKDYNYGATMYNLFSTSEELEEDDKYYHKYYYDNHKEKVNKRTLNDYYKRKQIALEEKERIENELKKALEEKKRIENEKKEIENQLKKITNTTINDNATVNVATLKRPIFNKYKRF